MNDLIVQNASGRCEGNRAFGEVSINFYHAQIKVDSVLDIVDCRASLSHNTPSQHARTGSLHLVWGFVSGFGDDLVLNRLAFFVRNA